MTLLSLVAIRLFADYAGGRIENEIYREAAGSVWDALLNGYLLISAIVVDLGTTVATLQLVIVAASLIAGSLMVTAGRLGDKFGRKKIFLTGVILYTIGLSVVVLAPNTAVFTLGWGVIWPMGMVLVIPNSIAPVFIVTAMNAPITSTKRKISAEP